MYCPQCGMHLAATTTRCPGCDLDLQPVVQLLQHGSHAEATQNLVQRWKSQRHALGLLLVMCSLLVGCLIPICIGLFGSFAGLSSLITGLAGLAGVLLVLGSMLLLAAEGQLLTSSGARHDEPAAHTGPTTPLLAEGIASPGVRYDEPAPRRVKR